MGSTNGTNGCALSSFKHIPLSYNPADSHASALRLVLALNPQWEGPGNKIEFVRFTDGITNTLLKIMNRKPGMSEEQIDNEAVLMRAYGNHTEIIIDREREMNSHALLSARGLAPPLLARFQNGLLYSFVRGRVCTPDDLVTPPVWRGVARRLGQWHAVLPVGGPDVPFTQRSMPIGHEVKIEAEQHPKPKDDLPVIQPRQPGPTVWTVLQKWILALPTATEDERVRRLQLQKELERVVAELDDGQGIGDDGLVISHCDLLSANVIILPPADNSARSKGDPELVHFIDYEYAVPGPAAFDIANHFAEWAGYDCDYRRVPTRSVRRQFLTEYVRSYSQFRGIPESSQEEIVDGLYDAVDRYRGLPGLYWGVWGLIQAQISQIDFDYSSYADSRLGEYQAWRREMDGSRAKAGDEMPLRERRWAQEA